MNKTDKPEQFQGDPDEPLDPKLLKEAEERLADRRKNS